MNKKVTTAACCILAAAMFSGCSGDAETETDNTQLKESEKKIEALEKRVNEMSDMIEGMDGYYGEDFYFDEEIHEVYDDTAVVEAYKTGDTSALTDEKDLYILECVTKAIDEIVTDGMTDYEKEKAVYEYIFKGTRFDYTSLSPFGSSEEYSHTPYGFFHDHTAICVGNATTFKLFMDILGIENDIIHSVEEGEHAWNIVKIEGEWYHVDITFDSGTFEPTFSHLNITDEAKLQDGYPWDGFPECNCTDYSYAIMNAEDCQDVYAIPEHLKKAFDSNKNSIYLKLPVPEEVDAEVFAGQLQCISESLDSDEYFISGMPVIVSSDKKFATVGFSIESMDLDYSDYIPDSGVEGRADIDYTHLRELFDKEFGGGVDLFDYVESEEMFYIYSRMQMAEGDYSDFY